MTGSINAGLYDSSTSTATVSAATNAPDFTPMKVVASSGKTLVFKNVYFTGAKCLMMSAAVSSGSTNKSIELYIDSVDASNKIGVLNTGSHAKVNDYDFTEQYADLAEVTGTHDLIFSFKDTTELELDWFKMTSYTGTETKEQKDARMEWWREAKYGQFIHMGAYSYLGGYYKGTKYTGYSEWIMEKMKISKTDYMANAAANFNPVDFDAEKIVSDAKAAGEKYIIITSRHHEGFSIYDTQIRNFKDYSLFSVGNGGNYTGPDPLKALSRECKKQGLHFGAYITIMDWYDPSQENYKDIVSDSAKAEYKAQLKGQVKELIEDYGVEVFFFDGDWVSWWTNDDGKEMYRYILSLNEKCIVNDRVGHNRSKTIGDYSTPEQKIPDTGSDYDWESCVTMNGSWGYKVGDNNWKTPQWIITSLLDVTSKGGNLLLNVGPNGNGTVQQEAINNMNAAGKWLAEYGQYVIYGAEANIFSSNLDSNIRVTTKTEETDEGTIGKIYVSLLEKDPKKVGTVTIPAVENTIISAIALTSGKEIPYQSLGDKLLLDISETEKQDYATIFEITVVGAPEEAYDHGNLAYKKEVSASSVYSSNYSAGNMVDGNTTSTRWAPDDSEKNPYAVIDLGKPCTVGSFVLYEYKQEKDTKQYRCASFKVSASTDGENWEEIYTGGEIGEREEFVLYAPAEARYLKIHDFEKLNGSTGNVSIYEWEVYAPDRLDPNISIDNTADKIMTPSITLTGTCSDCTGSETVSVKVKGETLPAFTVPAEVVYDENINGTWSLTLSKASLAEENLTFTAYLCGEDGSLLAADTYYAEYVGTADLSRNDSVKTESSTEFSGYYSAEKLLDGDMTTRWAPKDPGEKGDNDPSVIIDLGSCKDIGSIALYEWFDDKFDNAYRCESFKLSVSNDKNEWTQVYSGGEIGEKLVAALTEPVTAQYLKIYEIRTKSSKGNVSLLEVEIYPPDLSGTVKITGEAKSGKTLTASLEDGNTAGDLSYQWKRDGVNISGATGSTCILSDDDIGRTITVTIGSTDRLGTLTGEGVTVLAPDNRVYTITFDPNGGTVTQTSDVTSNDGKLSSLPVPTRSGSYTFSGWYTSADGGNQVTTSTVFYADTTIFAHWTHSGNKNSISTPVNATGGTVTVSPKNASRGTTVTITVKPDDGYVLDSIAVTDNNGYDIKLTDNGDGTYSFIMPSSRVSVAAVFTAVSEESENPFTDVSENDYFYNPVLWAVKNGITEGTSSTTFSPGAVCTRAQMVTFLWRAAGCPSPKTEVNPFTDISPDDYYYNAVLWAAENNITKGTTETAFGPDDTCTRAHTVTFLYRAAGIPDTDAVNDFIDVDTDDYYAAAVDWAVNYEITNGTGNNMFSPDDDCSRDQIVTFLYRWIVR